MLNKYKISLKVKKIIPKSYINNILINFIHYINNTSMCFITNPNNKTQYNRQYQDEGYQNR